MKEIGDAAFQYAGLETLTLPEGFNSLGERCFKNSKLVNVVLPNSLTEIPREAFYNCRRLQTVQMSYGAQNEAYMSRSAEKWVRGLCFNEFGVCG